MEVVAKTLWWLMPMVIQRATQKVKSKLRARTRVPCEAVPGAFIVGEKTRKMRDLPQQMAHCIAFAFKQKYPGHHQCQCFTELGHEMALMDRNMLLQLTPSFTLTALTHMCSLCSLFSSQPSHHRSIMWHPVSWTPRAQWSPKHLKLVTVYVLVLLVSLSFASGQSRPFKHQIDNRSKYESHLT